MPPKSGFSVGRGPKTKEGRYSMAYARDDERSERMAKIRQKIRHDYEELDRFGAKDLEKKIVECQANVVETEREKKEDKDLARVKDKLATVSAPYKEAKTRLTAMMEYATLRLEELGKA